ncbi:hypothetical protein [Microbulbifer taiwanensis]|uniref:hypothetical protein n=1 Tax=Microbulbifer taiwanensis TaxID=986746 RepID=UPI0036112AFE
MSEAAAGHTLSILLDPQRAARLGQQHARSSEIPGFGSLLDRLTERALAADSYSGLQAVIHQRVNHAYIQRLMQLAGDKNAAEPVRAQASLQLAKFRQALGE